VKLKDLLVETSPLKDYPVEVQKKYKDYLKNWDKDMADRYLKRVPDPNDKSEKTLETDVYEKLKIAKQNTANEMKKNRYGSEKYPVVLYKHLSIQLRKLGKITDTQLHKLISNESLHTIWDETKFVLKIFNKNK
jgi:hypothetical protein